MPAIPQLPDFGLDGLAGKDGFREAAIHGHQGLRAIRTEAANQRAADHPESRKTVENGPLEACPSSDFRIGMQRVAIPGQAVDQGGLWGSRQGARLIGFPLGHRRRASRRPARASEAAVAATEERLCRHGDQLSPLVSQAPLDIDQRTTPFALVDDLGDAALAMDLTLRWQRPMQPQSLLPVNHAHPVNAAVQVPGPETRMAKNRAEGRQNGEAATFVNEGQIGFLERVEAGSAAERVENGLVSAEIGRG